MLIAQLNVDYVIQLDMKYSSTTKEEARERVKFSQGYYNQKEFIFQFKEIFVSLGTSLYLILPFRNHSSPIFLFRDHYPLPLLFRDQSPPPLLLKDHSPPTNPSPPFLEERGEKCWEGIIGFSSGTTGGEQLWPTEYKGGNYSVNCIVTQQKSFDARVS